MRFQDAVPDARAATYARIQADPLVADAAEALADAIPGERLLARAVMNGETLDAGGWRTAFPTLFDPGRSPDELARAERVLAASLAVAERGAGVRDQFRGAIVEAVTATLLARRAGAAVRRERRILFDGVRTEVHPYDVTVERPGAAEAHDCKWGARGINADVLHQLDDARAHAAEEGERLAVGLVVFDAARSCRVRLAAQTAPTAGIGLVTLETLDRLARESCHLSDPYRLERPNVPAIPVIAHVPHAGTWIPPEVRAGILLDDADLGHELLVMTDHHTDVLFGWTVRHGASALVNQWSRLVLDPERFEDPALEPMEQVGQGAVYTATSDGRPLRHPDAVERAALVERLYHPWHRALATLVSEAIEAAGTCQIIDCHSFGTVPLATEADQTPDRPDVCVGTDEHHTPSELAEMLVSALRTQGFSVRRDSPFSGAMVPADRYQRDLRVRSVMLEVRRGLYCDEATGVLLPGWRDVAARLERACVGAGLVPA